MAKVSVIVPIYNVSRFIKRCVESLFNQTLDDVEFIFVNDCTPDDSIDILKKVIADYPDRNTMIINHEVNKGLPAARNTGLKAASGDYIFHCDSDDLLSLRCSTICIIRLVTIMLTSFGAIGILPSKRTKGI